MTTVTRSSILVPVIARRTGNTHFMADKIISLFGANLISLLPMTESSGTTAVDASGNGRNGTYSNVTLSNSLGPDGAHNAPLFVPGSSSYVDWYSASLATAFTGTEGTFLIWLKVSAAAIWTNAVNYYMAYLYTDASNYMLIRKDSGGANVIRDYQAAGTREVASHINISGTTWQLWGCSWSDTGDEVQTWQNDAALGAAATGVGTWSGALGANTTLIGANAKTGNTPWSGWMSHAMLINRAITVGELGQVYAFGNP